MAANWSPKPKERVQFLHYVQLVLWCNWIARNTTDVLVWVRFLIELRYGQFGRGGRWDCKSYGVGSIPTLTSIMYNILYKNLAFRGKCIIYYTKYGVYSVMVARQIVVLLVWVRIPLITRNWKFVRAVYRATLLKLWM